MNADEIKRAREIVIKLKKLSGNDVEERLVDIIANLVEHVAEHAGQIATLKAALVKDRFWRIWKGGECASVEKATAKAEHQLAREMPDIFGDGKE